jgi:hypothetical protein
VFFRGLGICSARAFVVNAVQWAVCIPVAMDLDIFFSLTFTLQIYEWTMKTLKSGAA